MPRVKVISDDGRDNMSAEVWTAFTGEGILTASMFYAAAVKATTREQMLSAGQVTQMLALRGRWALVVPNGDHDEVLERDEFAAATTRADHVARLRGLSKEDRVALAEADTEAAGLIARLRDAKTLPLTGTSLLAAVAGIFGLANRDKDLVVRPTWMAIALVLGLVGLIGAIVLSFLPIPSVIKLSRLDEVRKRYRRRVRRGAAAGAAMVVVFSLTLVAIGFAVFPAGGSQDAPSAVIELNAVSPGRSEGAIRAQVAVTWSGLGERAAWVRTTVTRGDGLLELRRRRVRDGGVDQPVDVNVPAAGDVEVQTAALGSGGRQVGYGSTRVLAVQLR
jgi:hypothetical protein